MASKLPKIIDKKAKRIGRGYGSGKGGHTVGRGQKGQKTRAKIGILFEGVKVKKSLYKRLPLSRGKGKFSGRNKPLVVNLSVLNLLSDGVTVDAALLIKEGIIRSGCEKFGIKILGGGKLTKKLKIVLPISKSAAKMVEKAGGKVL